MRKLFYAAERRELYEDKGECQVLIVINAKTMNQQQEKENDANHPVQSTTTIPVLI